jgi:hypothetical protein
MQPVSRPAVDTYDPAKAALENLITTQPTDSETLKDFVHRCLKPLPTHARRELETKLLVMFAKEGCVASMPAKAAVVLKQL